MASVDIDHGTSSGCPKLDSTNWSIWKRRIADVLRNKLLWKYAVGTARPTVNGAETDATKKRAELDAHQKWVEEDDRAAAIIRLHMSDTQLAHVDDATSCQDVCRMICDVHDKQQGMGSVLDAHRQPRQHASP